MHSTPEPVTGADPLSNFVLREVSSRLLEELIESYVRMQKEKGKMQRAGNSQDWAGWSPIHCKSGPSQMCLVCDPGAGPVLHVH